MAPPPPELVNDTTTEIFLRISPDEPARLIQAALVCKLWRRILSDRAFLRRYREFHQAPPMLGVLQNSGFPHPDGPPPQFVPTIADPPRLSFPVYDWSPLDCRHGRALLRRSNPFGLVVWDPISGTGKELGFPVDGRIRSMAATVLCAADGCDHLDCRSGPFRVVAVGTNESKDVTWGSVYSSETGAWSAAGSLHFNFCMVTARPGRQIGDALYFLLSLRLGKGILKYDLTGGTLSALKAPGWRPCHDDIVVMTTDDGALGLAVMEESTTLSLWSWNDAGRDEGAGLWVKTRVVDLLTLLPSSPSFSLMGFIEGTDSIFVHTYVGVFALNLKSGHARKLGVKGQPSLVVPYLSFYTPDLLEAEARLAAS